MDTAFTPSTHMCPCSPYYFLSIPVIYLYLIYKYLVEFVEDTGVIGDKVEKADCCTLSIYGKFSCRLVWLKKIEKYL